MSKVEYSTDTEGDTMTDTFICTLADFLDVLNDRSMREICMEKLEDAAADWSRFHLTMKFSGRYNDIIEIWYFSRIRLILKSEFIICHRRSSWDSCREERVIATKVNYINEGNQWQHLGTLLKSDILRDRDSFLINCSGDSNYGSLCLIIKFTVFQAKNDCYCKYFDESNVAVTELSHDLGQLLTSGLHSDVTLRSFDGKQYKAHKNVLASRSVVLKAHFEHNTTECQTNIIESHFEAEVLKEVLIFLYTSKVMRVDEIPEKLLAAADFYQLSTLKRWCEEALNKKLTTENVVETLELAQLYSAENLIQSAVEFITHGQTRQIIETERWANLNSIELVKKIFKLYIMAYDDNIKSKYSLRLHTRIN